MRRLALIGAAVFLAAMLAGVAASPKAGPSAAPAGNPGFCQQHPDHWKCQPAQPPPPPACANNADDDADGLIDYPADPGCLSASDTDETDPPPPPPPTGGTSPPGSIASDCSSDVTAPLLAWLNGLPPGATVSFGTGCYRIEGTLELRDRTGLTLDGGTFRSFDPPDDQRAVWRIIDSTGIVFTNMTIVGSFPQSETNPTHDAALQHAHAIDLRGTHADITNLTASNLAGDCVYFGLGYTTQARSSGSVRDSSCRLISRNAVSVTAGDDIVVERVSTAGIGFIAFDIEPNVGPGWGSARVTVRDNTIGSYYLYAYALVENAPLVDQAFAGNTATAAKGMRVAALPFQAFRPQRVTITGNTASATTASPALDVSNVDRLTVTNNQLPTTTLLQCSGVTGLTFSGNTPNTSSGC